MNIRIWRTLLLCLVGFVALGCSTSEAGPGEDNPPAPSTAPTLSAADRCHRLYSLTDTSHAVEPGILVEASDEMPAFCQVNGVIDGTTRFQVSMPVAGWTGRFMHHAPGGLAGVIGDTTSLLSKGFAMATTDAGHDQGDDPAFYRDEGRKLNFAFRANHLTAVLAKRVISTFYGRDAEHSYLWGCSNGGRAALMEALLYPEDFDGIIAGAPAIDYGPGLLPWALEGARHQRRNPITRESVALLDANSKQACDDLDGVADGLIGDPRKCTIERLKLDDLKCENGPVADCLTAGQIETARFFYTGITDEAGNVLVPGVYPGAETGGDFDLWVTGAPEFMDISANELTAQVLATVMHRQPGFELEQFDPAHDLEELARVMASVTPPKPDFSRFHASGGKLIIYNGWHDFPCRAKVLENYHAEAMALNGAETVDEFMRTFMVPGMVHCIGGPGAWAADYIQAIVDWVEKDIAPDRLVAEHPGNFTFLEGFAAIGALGATVNWHDAIRKVGDEQRKDAKRFTRPLCPYPQYARYTGSGSVDDADNFSCVGD